MSRYFFNLHGGGGALPDLEGTELTGLDMARSEAIRTVGEILSDGDSAFWDGHGLRMEVKDEAGRLLLVLQFSIDTGI